MHGTYPAGLVEAVGLAVGVTRDTVGFGAPLVAAAEVALPGRAVPDAGLREMTQLSYMWVG